MTGLQIKLFAAAGVALFFVALGLGVAGGYWLTARHYRPIVATALGDARQAGEDLASCKTFRSSLEGQVGEQNLTIKSLQAEADQRAAAAKVAADQARADAEQEYRAANRLQQERTGGDPATAAAAIIDKELGL